MEGRAEILAAVKASASAGETYVRRFHALEDQTFSEVYPLVLGYIRERFFLTEEPCKSDKLLDLADESLRHVLELKKQGVALPEISRGCGGASSVITKKVLLMKAIEEDFSVPMSPEISGKITTVTELASYLVKTYQEGSGCPSRRY